MTRMNRSYTSESVTEGHPDKVSDQISDAILDALLRRDPIARVACETLVTTGLVLVTGEISTDSYVDIPGVVRTTVKNIGYTRAKYGFDGETCAVLTAIDEQSPDIAQGVIGRVVDEHDEEYLNSLGAGDQGIVFGYACRETPELMPFSISLAHRLARRLAYCRRNGVISYLRPDGKSQCTVEVGPGGLPLRVANVVVSAQHRPDVGIEHIREDILERVILPVIPDGFADDATEYLINPTGRFAIGGPQADAGLTGRKIIVDSYGGRGRHGGGCFSGKDPTKVDRSGSYAARHAAKNVVAAGLADECELEVAYAIGIASPLSIRAETFGTSRIPEETIEALVREVFDFRPAAIILDLCLRRPIYEPTAAYGHFGRTDIDAPWEQLDRVEELRSAAGFTGEVPGPTFEWSKAAGAAARQGDSA